VGTSIDMICLNPEGRLILLEFKTGYKDYFENADGFMHGCLKSLRNTPQNQATLQLTTSALILQKKYAVPLSKMSLFLLRVDDESLDIVPVDNLFVERIGPSIYKDLLEFNNNRTSVTTTTTTTTRCAFSSSSIFINLKKFISVYIIVLNKTNYIDHGGDTDKE
jgi:hypothetical protein